MQYCACKLWNGNPFPLLLFACMPYICSGKSSSLARKNLFFVPSTKICTNKPLDLITQCTFSIKWIVHFLEVGLCNLYLYCHRRNNPWNEVLELQLLLVSDQSSHTKPGSVLHAFAKQFLASMTFAEKSECYLI